MGVHALGLSFEQLRTLGGDPFNMTVAGLRLARHANAVAELHARTSREMWKNVAGAAPIGFVTNGVHRPTWQDARVRAAAERKDAEAGEALWGAHQDAKRELVALVKERSGVELSAGNLVIGFARRAAAYKRSDLILRDPRRIEPLLERRHLQLIFAGKAHPHDEIGKRILQNLARLARQYPRSVVFLENYDLAVGRALTRGCDVWLNNPIRPFEASGTSGMKAAMNGVLNLSVLDGWWPEGCEHGVNGWQIGDAYEGEDRDEHDMRSLHDLLEREVVPTYYGDQARWVRMMRASIAMSEWRFSTDRMVRQYYDELYSLENRLRAVS
jgi:starch phosphorylase